MIGRLASRIFGSSRSSGARRDASVHDPLRVLVSAFYCGPGRGSEQGNGWNWAMQAARNHQVWVITSSESQRAIQQSPEYLTDPSVTFVFWNVPFWPARWIHPYGRSIRVYYILWQLTVLARGLALNRSVRFNVVHHVTFNTIEVPGFLWLLRVPFVWGPVGGAQLPPRSLKRFFGGSWIGEELRILRKRLVPFNPIVRLALRKAHTVMVANDESAELLHQCGKSDLVSEIDVGVDPDSILPKNRKPSDGEFVMLWAGLLIPRKGPLLALEAVAAARLEGLNVRLLIAGDGPMRPAVEARIKELGLTDTVELRGVLSPDEMSHFYDAGDAFLFTSLHDTSGTVVLEAMARELPVVTLDHQGARVMVDELSGIRVPVASDRETVLALANAIIKLHQFPELANSMGKAGRVRVIDRFAWNRRGRTLERIYASAVAS